MFYRVLPLLLASVTFTASGAFAHDAAHHHAVEATMTEAMTEAPVQAQIGAIEISQARFRATPPRAPVGGGYLTIANTGDSEDRLLGLSGDFAERFEIHEMIADGENMLMRPVENGVLLPAGEVVTLAPGGLHIMAMGLNDRLLEGESRALRLQFEKAGEVVVEFTVEPLRAKAGAKASDVCTHEVAPAAEQKH